MSIKKFAQAVDRRDREELGEDDVVEFMVGEVTLRATRPKRSAFTKLVISGSRNANVGDRVEATYEFLKACLGTRQYETIQRRLDDVDDAFDIEDVAPITEWLIEQFAGGTPTKP